MTPIRIIILDILATVGGEINGTNNLCNKIPADVREIKRTITDLRKSGLIRSVHAHGDQGRGHLATHKLTRAGWLSVRLTEKGKEYVQFK
jgi:hypothetical protein